MPETEKEYIKADFGLLSLLLIIYAAVNTVILLALSLILGGKAMLFALLISSALYVFVTAYAVAYFMTVKYEKEVEYIKIISGVIIKKYTYINTDPLPFVANYSLPFNKGFSIIRIYGGVQVIFSTKVL